MTTRSRAFDASTQYLRVKNLISQPGEIIGLANILDREGYCELRLLNGYWLDLGVDTTLPAKERHLHCSI